MAKKPSKKPTEETETSPEIPPVDTSPFGDDDDGQNVGDIVIVDPIRMKVLQSKGVDVRIDRCRIERWRPDGQGRIRIPGELDPQDVTVANLRRRYGPGKYLVRAVNAKGNYIASGTAQVGDEPIAGDAAEPASAENAVAPALHTNGSESFAEKLLLVVLPAMFQQRAAPAPADDSLRETMGAMSKMIALQMQLQTANAMRQQNPAAPDASVDRTLQLLKVFLEQSKPAAAPARKEMGLAEFLPLLQMGMNIGSRMSGGGGFVQNPGEKPLPAWAQMIPELADTIGVPLVATIAQGVLPKDTAEAVLKLMQEHLETRKVEAEAEAAAADAVETEGVEP